MHDINLLHQGLSSFNVSKQCTISICFFQHCLCLISLINVWFQSASSRIVYVEFLSSMHDFKLLPKDCLLPIFLSNVRLQTVSSRTVHVWFLGNNLKKCKITIYIYICHRNQSKQRERKISVYTLQFVLCKDCKSNVESNDPLHRKSLSLGV